MTEEEKQAELAAAEQAKARENETPEQKQSREAKEREESLKKEYEAQLGKERKAREDAEKATADLAFKMREAKRRKDEDEDDGLDDDKPLTGKQLEVILARERQTTQTQLEWSENERIAKELARIPEEAQLTLEVLKSTTFPSHYSRQEKVEAAWAIANRNKLIGEHKEALRALRARGTADNNAAGAHHDPLPSDEPKLSPADELALKAVGFVWNAVSRRYEKKLKNGSTLVRDSKTKATFLIKAK